MSDEKPGSNSVMPSTIEPRLPIAPTVAPPLPDSISQGKFVEISRQSWPMRGTAPSSDIPPTAT
jgi:hypothetical protein